MSLSLVRSAALAAVLAFAGAAVVAGATPAQAAPTSAEAAASPTLQQGSQGPAVTTAQQLLRKKGFLVDVDGSFGPETATLVKAFQSSKHLAADGIIGPKTWAALRTAPVNGCETAIAAGMPAYKVPTGWKVLCVGAIDGYPNAAAVTDSANRQILVKNDMTAVQMRGVLGHEYAHAEAGYFSEATRNKFTKAIGAPYWWGPSYYQQAGELYAENRARCTGWRKDSEMDSAWRKLDCKIVNAVA